MLTRAAALVILVALAFPQSAAETGYPPVRFFRQEQHKGGTQTFDVWKDHRGRLYFSNSDGVLIFDGAWWSRVEVPGFVAFRTVTDEAGRIGVTAVDEFGYLEPGASGLLEYRSLASHLPEALRKDIGQAGLCAVEDGLLYVTEELSALWNGRALRVVERIRNGSRTRRCAVFDGRTFIYGFQGVKDLHGRVTFAGRRIDTMTPRYVVVRNEGLFRYDESPLDTDASRWLQGKGVMDSLTLQDGRIAVATLRHGLLVMTSDGTIDQVIDSAAGLPEAYLYAVQQDDEGALWLSMDTLIARVDISAPLTVFDGRLGLEAHAQAITRHAGRMHIATPRGLFVIDSEAPLPAIRRSSVRRLADLGSNNPWSLLSSHGDLLVGTYGGVLVVRHDQPPELIDGTSSLTVYAMTGAPDEPSLVLLGTDDGIARLRREGVAWKYEGPDGRRVPHVRSLLGTREGDLWVGTQADGAVRIGKDGSATKFGTGVGSVIDVLGRPVIVTRDGFAQPGPGGALVPDPRLGHIRSDVAVLYAAADAAGNVWMSTRPPRVIRRRADGSYEREAEVAGSLEGDATLFLADPDGTMWIGSDRGVYRSGARVDQALRAQTVPLIRRVIDGNDRTLLDALAGPLVETSLPHSFGRVRIEVAPLSYRAMTRYQYRLDPVDSDWGPWTEQAFLDYTSLDAGDYLFRVRTRGPGGGVSEEARWQFQVRAPWYLNRGMLAVWLILTALLLALFIRLRTRSLRHRARRLQDLVDEQTLLLRRANEQLEQQLLLDSLTGVANRRAFDRVLNESWQRSFLHGHPLSIIMLDVDHFKLLNDSAGHAAGDECLRRVAQYLESVVHGDADNLVARWGGEEFVILLGTTGEPQALDVAERIRAGVEALGVTISLGVASRRDDLDPEKLIGRADRALYAAKNSGRNCVRSDDTRKSA